ncbi:MAG TPA: hypothetical protein VJC16_01690 [Candidatus Nanoarchaeia archaeon]|nr:hypothetical protein [Candidatus Nanoarchaeia archaeon]
MKEFFAQCGGQNPRITSARLQAFLRGKDAGWSPIRRPEMEGSKGYELIFWDSDRQQIIPASKVLEITGIFWKTFRKTGSRTFLMYAQHPRRGMLADIRFKDGPRGEGHIGSSWALDGGKRGLLGSGLFNDWTRDDGVDPEYLAELILENAPPAERTASVAQ